MKKIDQILQSQLNDIKEQGTYKNERIIDTAQESEIGVNGKKVLNFCANNYLGLANNYEIRKAAMQAIEEWGFGLGSVRFICGTQTIHKELENSVSTFLDKEDTILYSSCFDANGGLFETILSEEDAVFSDELNHASIIDGIRLCKAQKYRYKNCNMNDLEDKLSQSNARVKLIVTDGVFSMDGTIAPVDKIVDLANQYNALVMVDDCHATGFIGSNGKGSGEYCGVLEKVDIISSTFGKALGGASGGFISASKNIVDTLRQKSRPYLFSNSLAPALVVACLKALEIINSNKSLISSLHENTSYFRKRIKEIGYELKGESHPIVPIMIYDAKKTVALSEMLLEKNIYVIPFSFPVVPKDQARIRVQLSSLHTREQLEHSINAFEECGKALNII
ncbi:MAG: glycine C-acetyltransferase [Candidatus Neomarinimicrobiota bacterium]|jgi:glycine C-acetyltransferase|tara:strand:- start:2844 stop:4022 length:1179 start_codon:yes stop_codon:yes gene_type:complete